MSVRFQARVAADTISEYLSAATRGAPVAQTKHSRTATLIGEALDVGMGATAASLYDVDAARIAMGIAYLARGGLAALGATFTGMSLSLGGAGREVGDHEQNTFNRKRRFASAAINGAIGAALLTGIAGREAAMAGTAKGVAEAAFGPLAESLTRPTVGSIRELMQIFIAPPSERQQRVAASDLRLLGINALPALCDAYSNGVGDDRATMELIKDIVRWPKREQHSTITAVIWNRAVRLLSGDKQAVRRGVDLLGALNDDLVKTISPASRASLTGIEQQHADAATGTKVGSDERETRDLASVAMGRLRGVAYVSLNEHMRNWDTSPEALSNRVAAIRAFGEEAIEPLRASLPQVESYANVVSLGAEVAKRLETMAVAEALSVIPDGIGGDGARGEALIKMRNTSSIDRQQLDNCVSQAPGMVAMRDAYRQILSDLQDRPAAGHTEHPALSS